MMHAQDVEAAEALFEQTQKQFGVLATLGSALNLGALAGFNPRTRSHRVKTMRRSDRAIRLETGLAGLGAAGLSYFTGLAAVSKEQAEAAFRYTAIVNFTAPITVLVIFNQILEGGIMGALGSGSDLEGWVLSLLAAAFVVTMVGVVSYAYIGAQMARDVLHLAQLEQARRGSFSPAGPEAEDGMVEPPDL